MPTPYVSIADGSVSGTLSKGGTFYWYNPTSGDVAISIGSCGGWCGSSSYTIDANQQYSAAATILASPSSPYTWTESPNRWTAPSTPRTQGPIHHPTPGNKEKEVA